LRPDILFERTDLLCDPRRCEIETTCGFGNRSVIDHCDEALKKTRVHTNRMYLLKIELSIFPFPLFVSQCWRRTLRCKWFLGGKDDEQADSDRCHARRRNDVACIRGLVSVAANHVRRALRRRWTSRRPCSDTSRAHAHAAWTSRDRRKPGR